MTNPSLRLPSVLLLRTLARPLLAALLLPSILGGGAVSALHADEAGLNDFLLKSAGHGDVGVAYARLVSLSHDVARYGGEKVWVTSQSRENPGAVADDLVEDGDAADGGGIGGGEGSDYCAVAARNVTTGDVLWRADACSSSGGGRASGGSRGFVPRHATLASVYLTVFSLDESGVLRGWNTPNGALVLDVDVLANIDPNDEHGFGFPGGVPRLLDAHLAIGTVVTKGDGVGQVGDESLVLLDTGAGQPIKEEGYHHQQSTSLLSARTLLGKAKVSGKRHARARILGMHLLDEANSRIGIWVGWSTNDGDGRAVGSFSSMAFAEVALTPKPASDGRIVTVYQIVRAAQLNVIDVALASAPIWLSSLRMVRPSESTASLLAISVSGTQVLATAVDLSTTKSKHGQVMEIDALHPYWRSIASIHVDNTRAVVDADTGAGRGSQYHVVRVAGLDDRYPTFPRRTESLFFLSGGAGSNALLHRVYGKDEEVHQDALAYCAEGGLVVAASQDDEGRTVAESFSIGAEELRQDSRRATWMPRTAEGDGVIVPPSRGGGASHGLVKYAHLLECSERGMTVAFATMGGMTTSFRFEKKPPSSDVVGIERLWSSEEALGSVSSAVFLDETHAVVESNNGVPAGVDADSEEEQALRNLEFVHRIRSQLTSFQNFVQDSILGGGALSSLASLVLLSDEKKAERGVAFGFAKISVLLSERLHRIVALDTARKGRVVWSMNLHPRASWHKLVHGGQFVSLNDPHGNGGVHDHEMLALSYLGSNDGSSSLSFVEWKCFDGTTGRVFSSETFQVSSSVVQIAPLRSSTHHPHELKSCRQVALLVHSDRSVSVVPDTARSHLIVDEAVSTAGQNGLFVHSIDKGSGEFHALRVSRKSGSASQRPPESNPFELVTVGTTIFDPSQERIVNVAYPRRGEAIQSPSTVLGDDALLLKYLNPHLMVVVTEATPSFLEGVAPVVDGSDGTGNGFYNALVGGQYSGSSSAGQKRKPLGASKPGADAPPPNASASAVAPSLFVSLIDSVSGQILHRVSHAHALASDLAEGAPATQVPVVVSENWVVYAFFNQRTRRTDVGVLTLHEGMIDKNGITAFSAPEQELSFSSLESAKPIVLSKTFGLAKAVTALGVTTTRAGISSKQFLFGTANDQVISIDRRMLDPRRPNGELKESEKMEGLMRYAPLLPIVPLRTPSHSYEVSNVRSIASAAAHVESQSLVLAHGGPDVFFARLAPSKGFDLLPDDFNRGLLSLVLVGLIVLLNVIQRMNRKKMVATLWM